ncbi:MAG: hypothetical protein GVY16_12305 [Planctomycetes bacterium]|jgi:hypothetical protein|nr:hypothetical protein [Planctomycetota bacterium]
MLGIILLLIGVVLIIIGALGASSWIDASQTTQQDIGFAFITGVVAPLLGGGLLIILALMELNLF